MILSLLLLSKERIWIFPAKLLIKSIQRKKIQSQSYYSRAGFSLLVVVWISKIVWFWEVAQYICQSSRFLYRACHLMILQCLLVRFYSQFSRSNNFWSARFLCFLEIELSPSLEFHLKVLLFLWTTTSAMNSNLEVKMKSPLRSRCASNPLHLWVGGPLCLAECYFLTITSRRTLSPLLDV